MKFEKIGIEKNEDELVILSVEDQDTDALEAILQDIIVELLKRGTSGEYILDLVHNTSLSFEEAMEIYTINKKEK
jgi:hypothetical protein